MDVAIKVIIACLVLAGIYEVSGIVADMIVCMVNRHRDRVNLQDSVERRIAALEKSRTSLTALARVANTRLDALEKADSAPSVTPMEEAEQEEEKDRSSKIDKGIENVMTYEAKLGWGKKTGGEA